MPPAAGVSPPRPDALRRGASAHDFQLVYLRIDRPPQFRRRLGRISRDRRQIQRHGGAASNLAFEIDLSARLLDQAVHDEAIRKLKCSM